MDDPRPSAEILVAPLHACGEDAGHTRKTLEGRKSSGFAKGRQVAAE